VLVGDCLIQEGPGCGLSESLFVLALMMLNKEMQMARDGFDEGNLMFLLNFLMKLKIHGDGSSWLF
jgi:hypothetical protein